MCDLTPDQRVTLSDSVRAPSDARNYVRQHGCPQHLIFAMDALLLITSELVTNAVRYGQPPIVLRLDCLISESRISVSDTGPDLPRGLAARGDTGDPRARLPREGARGSLGMGLIIVAKASREWGTDPLTIGKEVWCRIPTGILPMEVRQADPLVLDVT